MRILPLPALPAGPLRVVFFGTPEFAATILQSLLRGAEEVVGVFARPDAPRGRGLVLTPPPTKTIALEHGIPVAQPRSWKDSSALEVLQKMKPDLVIVAAYGRLLPQAALDLPPYGCINVHASLLPRWRGADPISRAILAGDDHTGVTIMQMILEMDAGAILHQSTLPISPTESGGELEVRLAQLGGESLAQALQAWRSAGLSAQEQDPSQVTMAPMIQKSDGRIDWTQPATQIECATRALDPWPGATTTRNGGLLKIWRARVAKGASGPPGTVVSLQAEGPLIATGRDGLVLLDLQAAGKRRMAAAQWANGARLECGETLGR